MCPRGESPLTYIPTITGQLVIGASVERADWWIRWTTARVCGARSAGTYVHQPAPCEMAARLSAQDATECRETGAGALRGGHGGMSTPVLEIQTVKGCLMKTT